MPLGLKARRCANHPDRPGLATCMRCRKVLCQECATQWDGINYCTQCIAEERKTEGRRRAPVGRLAILVALPLLLYGTARAMAWALVVMRGILS